MSSHPALRRALALALSTVLALAMALVASATPAAAQQTIGYPNFSGPAVPQPPVGYTTGDMMRAIYNSEAAGGGTDFWMDRLLARTGSDPAGNWLMTRGRALFMKTHNPGTLGFGGQAAYWESISNQSAYTVAVSPGNFSEQVSQRRQTPSHWRSVHNSGAISITQNKFITHQNVAVTNLAITNNGGSAQTLTVRSTTPYATSGSGGELVGTRQAYNNLTNLTVRFSGDQFGIVSGGLQRSVTVNAGQTVTVKLQMGFTTTEIPASLTEYTAYRNLNPANAFSTHVRAYNEWWADNVPYIDVPEPAIKKNIYYRWWLMRYNHLDANIPGQTFQFPTSMEGVLGYNNAIVLTQPMHVDDLKYLRDPYYGYGPVLSVPQISGSGRFFDNPGDPENWSNSYLQYMTEAAWRQYQLRGGPTGLAQHIAHYGELDVKDQLAFYNAPVSGNNPNLLWYCCNYLNGNDADNPSFYYLNRGNERTETAYVYSNAQAAAAAYQLLGNNAKANELNGIANNVQSAILNTLWHSGSQQFRHRDVHTNQLIPWKEINNYYPFTVGLVPNQQPYLNSLQLFSQPAQYPIFPFYTANQADKAAAAAAGRPGSNNFSTINSTVQFRLLGSVIRNYNTPHLDEEWYRKLLYWNAWAQYVGGNTAYPDANEFWADWNPGSQTIGYRSWIHHNILGSSNWTVIEDVAGLQPRTDNQVELWPIDIDWNNFTVNNVRYRNMDLTIVWQDPSTPVSYAGVPQGYSVYLNGNRAFTLDRLARAVYNPSTGAVSLPGGSGSANVLFNTSVAGMQSPAAVQHTSSHVVDMFAKAGIDATGNLPNFAQGASVSASSTSGGTSAAAAVSGHPTNEPFWGAGASGSTAWYQVNFGQQRTFDEVRLFFKDSRPQTGTYRAPASYDIQVLQGGNWVTVGGQVKTPTSPQGNYNNVRFPAVTGSQLRVSMTHASGSPRTGLTEVQVFNRGGDPPPPPPPPPPPTGNLATAATTSCSYTSPWESCAAVNNGDSPSSSNIPGADQGTRWGTWPETGSHWVELTWSSPVTVSSSEMYFFQDSSDGSNSGVKRPASWNIQYWTGSAWANVGGASGYPTQLDQFNSTTFNEVTTTALRANVTTRSDASGVGALEWQVFGPTEPPPPPPPPPPGNLALSASATCSYTSPWESCAAVNNGDSPSSSNIPGANQETRWGTWPETGSHWVELTWSSPVTVGSSEMYFFQDSTDGSNSGVKRPASWNIQYWTGSAWANVSGASGYPTQLDQFNATSFNPVTTTRLRANLTTRSDASGVGALEWRLSG